MKAGLIMLLAVAAAALGLINTAFGGPVSGLSLSWPVPTHVSNQPTQDYGHYADGSATRHHSGMDIGSGGATNVNVVAAAGGTVERVLLLSQIPNNRCMGNVVVLRHGSVYTLYAHLASIAVTANTTVTAGQTIGVMGNTTGLTQGGAQCDPNGTMGVHLHFELKNHRWLGQGPNSDADGWWGYTPFGVGQAIPSDHPDTFGFHDPVHNLHSGVALIAPPQLATITADGGGISSRLGPATNYNRLTNWTISAGQQYNAVAQSGPTTGCSLGWAQVRRTNSAYFPGANLSGGNSSHLAEVWLCKGNSGQTWVQVGQSSSRIIALSGDLAFGSVTVGQSAQRTLTISNTGNSALSVSGISYPSGVFSGNWSGTVAAGGSRNVTVTFTPTAAQSYSGNLTVASNATSGTGTRAISGSGTSEPILPPALLSPGTNSDTGFVVGNLTPTFFWTAATGAVRYGLYISREPYGAANIVYEPTNLTGTSHTIPAGVLQSNIKYRWNMTSFNSGGTESGVSSTTLHFMTPSVPTTRIIGLTGDLAFGSVPVGQSAQRTLTISNSGNSALSVTGISYPSGVFSGNWSGTVAAGGSRNVTVTFTPTAAQSYSGNLTVASNATSGTGTRAISGSGTSEPILPPALLSPGTNSDTGFVVGNLTPTFFWTAATGAVRYGLYVSREPYGAANIVYEPTNLTGTSHTIPAGVLQSNIKYRWNMTSFNSGGTESGVSSTTLHFMTPSVPTTRIIGLNGDLAFGSVPVGQSAQRTLTISNTGNSALSVTGISYPSGVFSGNWSGTVAAGGGQNVTVTFTPTAAQSYSGNLTVASNATSGTGTRAISGSGESPTLPSVSITSPSGNQTVSNETTSFAFSGTASAPGSSVSSVEWQNNGGSWTLASGAASWSFTANGLVVGPNVISVRSRNIVGATSSVQSRTITRQAEPSTFSLSIGSTGVSGVTIVGAPSVYGGTTDYSITLQSGSAISLTAPLTWGSYNFQRWNGCSSVSGPVCTVAAISADRAVVAAYADPAHQVFSSGFEGAGSALLLFDDFSGDSLQAAYWTSSGPGLTTVSGGTANFACGASINTANKVVVSGGSIVIEARLVGPGNLRDTGIQLYDISNAGNAIYIGDTSYGVCCGVGGLYVAGAGIFDLYQLGNGHSMNTFQEFRVTLTGALLTVERGDTLANIAESVTVTLPASTAATDFYLRLGTGNPDYCPGVFDWIRVMDAPSE